MAQLTVEVADIMPMINYAWDLSFAKVNTSMIEIAERGWFPMNRDLLLNTQLPSVMTTEDHYKESRSGIITPYHCTENFIEIKYTAPTLDTQFISRSSSTVTNKPNLRD